jgi:hypothetical protein
MSVKTFFEHVGEWFKEHLGSAATFEKTAATAISIAEPLLDTLLTLTAGEPFAVMVCGVVTQVKNDLNNTSAILNGAEATGGMTVTSLLTSVQTNLGTLLADADIKNSTKAADITGAVNTLIGEVEAILAAAPAPAAAATATA